ncbi:MAG: phospholipid/cholesterol/gamma-HCH transport system substrate-binding protein [Thermoleophilaceae bacterium]|nr:phospholipid/cholesterol/gamma-HCH transport system substrate-binding protein [Thermoleophilaceae bacterium]
MAVLVVGFLLFTGGGGYTVKLEFLNAQQLVYGNLVEKAGVQVGSVTKREITDDGHALITIKLKDGQPRLREGTTAIIRAGSLSSVANRYIELHLPSENQAGRDIPDGGTIHANRTTTGVEIDQFFDTFDRPTRKALQGFYRGNYANYRGRGFQANKGWRYLNPSLAGSATLFTELSKDTPVLESFLVNSSRFVTALADRRQDLTPLVSNLNRTTRALANEKTALAEVIQRFPDFMRQANTTYVNLRAALDDVDPFVQASKPVARKLRPFLNQLRPFANEAKPTVRDLSQILRRTGRFNDLTELNRTYPALAAIATETHVRNGKDRRGAFPELSQALTDSAPTVEHGRPYTVDLVGWFDDFSTTGAYDALGSFSRVQTFVNALSTQLYGGVIPREQRGAALKALLQTGEFKRCPGASEAPASDGSNVWSAADQKALDCSEADRAVGPRP